MSTPHTKTPWTIERLEQALYGFHAVEDGGLFEAQQQQKKLLADLVRAANSHDGLMLALEEARIKLTINFKHSTGEYYGGMEHSLLIDLIEAVLAKAQGPPC